MKFEYFTSARGAYYAAIAIIAFLAKTGLEPLFGAQGATAILIMLMWLLFAVDAKMVASSVSLIRPFLPGIGWRDVFVALPVFAALALAAYQANQAADRREFILYFILIMGVCAVFGVFALLRWQRWRARERV